jgi:hypothetical protein
VVLELFGSIMAIITRNLNQTKPFLQTFEHDAEKINALLAYIRINAVDNEKMDIKKHGDTFSHVAQLYQYICQKTQWFIHPTTHHSIQTKNCRKTVNPKPFQYQ